MSIKQPGHMNVYRSKEQRTKCICPSCETVHHRLLFWAGRGTPRKFCDNCLQNQERSQEFEPEYYANKAIGGLFQ